MSWGLFARKKPDEAELAAAARIKAETRALLALPDQVVIAVNEIICADPACPGTETVILVMCLGEKTQAFKAQIAMAQLTGEALRATLQVAAPQWR